jgi:1-pyrroline-5-carboxylate dehydrogenase
MPNGIFRVPIAKNEPVLSYAPGTQERDALKKQLHEYKQIKLDIPMIIGGQQLRSGKKIPIHPPHELKHTLGYYHQGDETHVYKAIDAAIQAKESWTKLSWEHRASIFLKAADLISGPFRQKLNAATMLAQSKNVFQAEIDAACELADFLRFNAQYMTEIYSEQTNSATGMWNRLEYRPLEGFVFALTPFNFTSIAGNLPSAPAIMGNTVVWKPSKTAIYSAKVIMDVFMEAGLPDGIINMVFASGPTAAKVILNHPEFAGIHFTGSTTVFKSIWKNIGKNIQKYKSYPRIVGETGGKDFILAHKSCDVKALVTAIVRGGFEYQGQKCSAASRVYVPSSRWNDVKEHLKKQLSEIKMGSPEDFGNFINAIIDEASYYKLTSYIDEAKECKETEIVFGGNYDSSIGYFIEPTIILTTNPNYITMEKELFGPIVTIYLYEDHSFEDTLTLLNNTSIYALTGSVFAKDRYAIKLATERLRNAAGNFYINDKPTAAVVGQQPFGGSRGSGTNDKAGSKLNLLRWASTRTIKETFVPPTDYTYPYLKK